MNDLGTGSVLAELVTPAHEQLLRRAQQFFTPDRLAGWRDGNGGALTDRAWRDVAQYGFLGVGLPREHGGQGLGVLGSVLLSEAMAQLGDGGVLLSMHVHNDVAGHWLADADADLRQRYLPRLLDGTAVACQCDTDPSEDEPTTATRTDDEIVIRGSKLFVINGDSAGLCFVSVQLDGTSAIVMVEKDRPGVAVAKVYNKLGTRTADSARVEFDDVRVPVAHVLSRGNIGQRLRWNRVMSRLRYLIAVDAYLIHQRLLDRIVRYSTQRPLGGRSLAAWPVNSHALARARADQELMAAGIAGLIDQLDGTTVPVPEVASLKWFSVDRACALAALCCDLEGGAGYMWDSPSLLDYAQLRGLRMAGGSQTTMLTIANHSFACRAELDAQPVLDPVLDAVPAGAIGGARW